jgi:hypothetical protein
LFGKRNAFYRALQHFYTTLQHAQELLDELPPEKKAALDNDAKFQDAVRSSEQGGVTVKSADD